MAKFPPIYALIAAVATIVIRGGLDERAPDVARGLEPFWDVVRYAQDGMIIVALVTLGAQLATVKRSHVRYPVTLAVFLRLLIGPALGLAMVMLLGLEGLVAQVLLVGTAMPTSVNCMLICLEFDNHPDFVARSVFYSTLLSPVTVTLTIMMAQSGWF